MLQPSFRFLPLRQQIPAASSASSCRFVGLIQALRCALVASFLWSESVILKPSFYLTKVLKIFEISKN